MSLSAVFSTVLFFLCLVFYLIFHRKKTVIIKKIRLLSGCEKELLINELIQPAGFCYDPEENIFTSTQNAWQRDFGYTALYDEAAPLTQMVFDCLPVYFDYDGKTWLVELWKGQYGINTGAEMGIYQTDTVIPPQKHQSTLFHSIPDEELPLMQLELIKNRKPLFRITERHWWLTGFRMGMFSDPRELSLKASITFSAYEMAEAFLEALEHRNPCGCELVSCGQTITLFWYSCFPEDSPCFRQPFRCHISQEKNRLFVKLYHFFTRPFERTADQLLFLWYLLPPAFHRMIQPRKKKCYRKCRKCKN